MGWPGGLYGHGMHDFVLRELEIGHRAAAAEDSERGGWSALDDLDYELYLRAQGFDPEHDEYEPDDWEPHLG